MSSTGHKIPTFLFHPYTCSSTLLHGVEVWKKPTFLSHPKLYTWTWSFLGNSNNFTEVKSILLVKISFWGGGGGGAQVKLTFWRVHANFNLPQRQAAKLTFFASCRGAVWFFHTVNNNFKLIHWFILERFLYDLELKTHAQDRNNKQAETDTNARMKNLPAQELSRNQPILCFDVILQHDWPIE